MKQLIDDKFKVVVNDEQQYSIWRTDRTNPLGWTDTGMEGSKDECLHNIQHIWTDMLPLSVRTAIKKSLSS